MSLPNATPQLSSWRALWPWVLVGWWLDLAIKYWVSVSLQYGERVQFLPWFDITLVHNKGAAFSFLANAGGWQRWFFAIIGVAVCIWLIRWMRATDFSQRWQSFGLGCVMAGALGNLTERIYNGYVVDYLLVYKHPDYFPAFNLADSLICLGAFLLLIDMWKHRHDPS